MFEWGADVTIKDFENFESLDIAIERSNNEKESIMGLLIKHGANVVQTMESIKHELVNLESNNKIYKNLLNLIEIGNSVYNILDFVIYFIYPNDWHLFFEQREQKTVRFRDIVKEIEEKINVKTSNLESLKKLSTANQNCNNNSLSLEELTLNNIEDINSENLLEPITNKKNCNIL